MRRICLIFLTISFLCVNTRAQNNVGAIIGLKGTARLKGVKGNKVKLDEKNYARSLQPKEMLIVDKNGQLEIWLCNGEKFFIPVGTWYKVPDTIICSPPPKSPKQQALEKRFVIGARHHVRGKNSFIRFPSESNEITDVIRPESAVFRWAPSTTAKLNLSVSVIEAENERWEKNDISGEEGSYTSDDLKQFLEAVREKLPDAELELKIKTASNKEATAIFHLFPKSEEQALRQELMNVKEDNELLLHLFRAEIYYKYNLFIEAADEYEEALRWSPESIWLLMDTAAVEEQAGNLRRSKELQNYIDKLSKETKK